MLHCKFQRTHAEGFCLGKGLLVGPMIVRDAVAGDGGAGAVRSASAVDEDGPRRVIIQDRKNGRDLRVGRSLVTVPRHAHVMHACLLDGVSFRSFAAQVDHGLDADFGQTGKALAVRLGATVDMFVNLMKIRYAGNGWYGSGPGQTH